MRPAKNHLWRAKRCGVPVDRPLRELKGFEKILLQPGESRTVHVRLTQQSFAYYDVNVHGFRTDAGQNMIRVGASSRDFRLSGEVELNGQTELSPHQETSRQDLLEDHRCR
jgi:beta-glucosidase